MSTDYRPLPTKSDSSIEFESETFEDAPTKTKREITVPLWLAILFVILQACGVYILISSRLRDNLSDSNPQLLYSPIQDAIEYEVVKFHTGALGGEDPDIYSHSPSEEVDNAWTDLYNFGIAQISEDEAKRLVNKTVKVEPSRSEYIIGIDVFHQLHCLNLIRKALYPDYYTPDARESPAEREIHLNHCINSLRQSLQCSADITPIVFEHLPGGRRLPRFDVVHSCRNFKKIQEWGMSHQASESADPADHSGH